MRCRIPADGSITIWRPEWFPVLSAYGLIVCDCGVVAGQPTPVRVIDHTNAAWDSPVVASMGEMIELWTTAWARGDWYAREDGIVPMSRRAERGVRPRHPLLDV